MDSIEEKIRRIQAGEGSLFSDVIRLYQQQIYLYCFRLLNSRVEAEDAVQDILIKAYQNIGQYKPQAGFVSWLYTIAYHHCLNQLRRQKFQLQLRKLLRQEVKVSSAEQVVENSLFSEPVSTSLGKLSAEDRNLLILRIYEEKSFAEIGEILGVSTATARKRYERTRTKLKKVLERKEIQLWTRFN
ncbi:DNA-directed RNA polymerase subunit sigma [Paenibacillus sp. FSL R7-0273]|uniref:RNA polymerase sigma factor n=1 Tax=Paenibacillus sp. FSL R7-0273 TaxID=1536772 RepID=UPI0004F620C6|nr:RNA polymerase sigma factor [Paenibacillus sp. FSL R7-0273]AIQ46060.1 DNA-directed RNA polymerase subunit sigma [Paenibacillus sp. FSL R7-0273]OMF92812.1 RNA polymerase subunit sigma [Paenibacillus sp. FSL R7-0273]